MSLSTISSIATSARLRAADTETIVIGAGQAGLSVSYHLKRAGHAHVVLERDEIGASWARRRWDSFTLVTPNWMNRLPGFPYDGGDADGFLSRDGIVRYLEDYAAFFGAPVVTGVEVTEVAALHSCQGYRIVTSQGETRARNVVVGAGFFHKPRLPAFARSVPPEILQLDATAYRNPQTLPPGAVLVVGSGQSGCQIAEELNEAGRRVFLAVGRAGREPRRYRGRDINYWLDRMGSFDRSFKDPANPVERYAPNPHCSGKAGGHALNLRRLASEGVTLTGRATGCDGAAITLAPDLIDNLAFADRASSSLMRAVDAYINAAGLSVPPADRHNTEDGRPLARPVVKAMARLHLADAQVSTIIWATGFECDYSWLRLPVLDARGYPLQIRGVSPLPGLYFCGLHWMHSLGSGLLHGVGQSAAHVVQHLLSRQNRRPGADALSETPIARPAVRCMRAPLQEKP